MKPIIIGNWKCNPTTLKEARHIFNAVKNGLKCLSGAEVVICPPFVYLPVLAGASASARGYGGLAFGSQDCFWEEKGAYTGEISPAMLVNLGCQYVIVGHSERRKYQAETDEMLNKKIIAALKAGLKPILCIGEREKERGRETKEILKRQLKLALKKISNFELQTSNLKPQTSNLIIAYEPVWAIGTGIACDVKTAAAAGAVIRKFLAELYGQSIAGKIPILYGGSVKAENASAFIKEAKMNGFIVGGASLNPAEFIGIIKAAGGKA